MEELRVEVLLVAEHAQESMKEPTHGGDEVDFLFLSRGERSFKAGLD
jgi:hypothetical protein